MAGDWIPMRLDLHEDPAVIQMADALGVREEVVVGYLHKIWSWMSRQCHAGSVTNVTLTSLGRVTNMPGFPELMCDVGWLRFTPASETSDGICRIDIPKWDRWLSKSAKARHLARKRKQDERHADVTEMSRCERDNSVTTEEKRREEKSNKKKTTSSSPEPASPPSGHDSVIDLPTNRSGIAYGVPPAKAAEWSESFPAVDVPAELRRIRQWLLDNPSRRKTARGMAAFVGRWLAKCQDRPAPAGGRNGAAPARISELWQPEGGDE